LNNIDNKIHYINYAISTGMDNYIEYSSYCRTNHIISSSAGNSLEKRKSQPTMEHIFPHALFSVPFFAPFFAFR